jgi:hypothetical protein
MAKNYDCLCLFSSGLDSILAARTLMAQGIRVKCLHFVSPFFGSPESAPRWREVYGLDIEPVDVSAEFVRLAPENRFGLGKLLNPCVDCKVFMASRAKALMPEYGARFIASGEVVGQRPMSQRRDAMNIVTRESGTRDLLLRPLCALNLDPTPMEESGLVDRERLHNFGGRGRKNQLALAEEFGLTDLPTPAGGCLLTEAESCRRYAPLYMHAAAPDPSDFELANIGRQFWSGSRWLAMGRNRADNERLLQLAGERDLVFDVAGFPGPRAVARDIGAGEWSAEDVRRAAALTASYSPKAVKSGGPVAVRVDRGGSRETVTVAPARETPPSFEEPDFEVVDEIKQSLAEHAGA